MESEAIKLLDALGEKFGLVIDWTSENVYSYLQKLSGKYVRYELITSVLWLLFSVGLIILGIYLINKGKCCFKKDNDFKKDNEKVYSDYYGHGCCCYLFASFAICIGCCVLLCQVNDIITCFTFPEKLFVNELRMLLK